jgi:hypothetical protein
MAYTVWNGPAPTIAALQKVATGTAVKTMSQLATPTTRQIRIVEWGYTLDAPPAGTGVGVVELLQTDVAATVTAHVASGLVNLDPNGTASLLTLGTSATGYTATAEGTITAARVFDSVEVAGITNGGGGDRYLRTFLPGQAQPIVAVSKFLRVRATFSATVNMQTFITYEEI